MADSSTNTTSIILPPTPKPGRTPQETLTRLQEWTRQCEQAVRALHSQIMDTQIQVAAGGLPSGGSLGEVLVKRSATDQDATWAPTHYIPVGGTKGQALRKTSSVDFEAKFQDVHEVPAGGTTGQLLSKHSNTDYDASWTDSPHGLPAGGTTRQALLKNSSTDYDANFASIHEVPAGGNRSDVLTKNSGTDYDAGWKSILGVYRDGVAIDIFDDYPTGIITAPAGGFGWSGPGTVRNGTIVTRNMSNGRTQNRLSLSASAGEYARTFNWGGEWAHILISVLFRANGPASTFTGNFSLGCCAGNVNTWGTTTTANWAGMWGSTTDPTWTYTAGALHPHYDGNHFFHATKVNSTITSSGNFAKVMTIPQDEGHLLAFNVRLPRSYVNPMSTVQGVNYNFYTGANQEVSQEISAWLGCILNSPTASGSDFAQIYASTSSTINMGEAGGAFDSVNIWWNNASSVNLELAAIAVIRKW